MGRGANDLRAGDRRHSKNESVSCAQNHSGGAGGQSNQNSRVRLISEEIPGKLSAMGQLLLERRDLV